MGGRGAKTSRKIEREEISPEEEKMIRALGQSPDVYQRLVDSFAPHIQGQSLIKEAILLLIVGSNQRPLGMEAKYEVTSMYFWLRSWYCKKVRC